MSLDNNGTAVIRELMEYRAVQFSAVISTGAICKMFDHSICSATLFLRILEYYLLFGKYFQISSFVRYYHKNFLPITMVDLAIFPVLWRLFFAVEFYFRPGLISLAHSCNCNVLVNQFCAVNWKVPGWHSCEISITIWVIIKNPGHCNQECPGVSWSRDCGSLSLSALSGPITPPPLPGIPPIVTEWAHIEGLLNG